MDPILLLLVRFIHIVSMAVLFGSGLTIAGDVRRTLALGKPFQSSLAGRLKMSGMLARFSGILTVLSGLGLIFMSGGFGKVPVRIHIGLSLTIILIIVAIAFTAPTGRKIAGIVMSDGDLTVAQQLSKKFSMLMGIEHFIRFVVLIVMVIKFEAL